MMEQRSDLWQMLLSLLMSFPISVSHHHVKLMSAVINIWFAVSGTERFHSILTNMAFCRVHFFPSSCRYTWMKCRMKYWSRVTLQKIVGIFFRPLNRWNFCRPCAVASSSSKLVSGSSRVIDLFIRAEQWVLISYNWGNLPVGPLCLTLNNC